MINNQKILATICARGGSKGVKNKNIKLLNNKPLIIYSLELINACDYIDDYVISTDSEEIINIVKTNGYAIHFKRPDELAGDKVSRIEPIRHAALWMEKENNCNYDLIIDIGVAAPLKNKEDINNIIIQMAKKNVSNIFSVTYCSRNPYYNMVEKISENVNLVKQLPDSFHDRRDAPAVFEMNDAFNIWKRDILFKKNPQFNIDTDIFIMPRERSIDIDEPIDFKIAELLINELETGK